jgi:hypothetical protein
MKTFKNYLKEDSGFPTGPVGENPNNLAGEVTDTLGSDVFNPQNLKRINAIIGAISNMEYILPEHAIHRLRGSLDKIHLTFPQVLVGSLIYHLLCSVEDLERLVQKHQMK